MSISKLLVVDDSKAIRTFVSRILSNAGYEVITAVDGFQALEKMAEEPSLMLLDVAMPGLDGYGVVRRASPRWYRTANCFSYLDTIEST